MYDLRPNALLRARRATAVLAMILGPLGCGGPDFSAVPGGDDAGDDRDNTPIILPDNPGPAEASDDVGDAARDTVADGDRHATVDGGSDAATGGGSDATVDARVGDATSEDAPADVAPDQRGGDALTEGGADVGSDAGSCPAGSLVCGGACVPNDARHCGACGHDCTSLSHVSGPVTCLASGACSFPVSSCAAGWTHCASNADLGCEIDVSTTSNCGGCGVACSGATPVCSGSGGTYGCASGCPASTPTLCGGSCVDTTGSASHCGSCANGCATSALHAQPVCAASACTIACNTGYALCAGACVDEQTDPGHCGGCGTTCGSATPVCLKGACVSCTPGAAQCRGATPQTCDPSGGWQSGSVTAGQCGALCTPGATDCNGAIPRSCDAKGVWQSGSVTAGQCGAVCTPGASQCSGISAVKTCDAATGQWGNAKGCAQPSPICDTGQGQCGCPTGDTVSNGACCPGGQSGCNGACVDEQTDNSNCGGCGLACSTGCSAGRCIVALASGQGNPLGLAVHGTSVYWANGAGTVMKIPSAGGTSITLASGQALTSQIAADATSVYWTTQLPGAAVKTSSAGGGTVTTLASGQIGSGIAVDAKNAYWTMDVIPELVMKAPVLGGTAATVASVATQQIPISLAVDATSIYWTNDYGGTLMKASLQSGVVTTLASGQAYPYAIAVDGTSVYWTTVDGGTVMKTPSDGSGSPTTLASGQNSPSGIAVDATSVYWNSDEGAPGRRHDHHARLRTECSLGHRFGLDKRLLDEPGNVGQ